MPTFPVAIDSANEQAHLSNFWLQRVGPFLNNGSRYLVLVDNNNGIAGTTADHTVRVWKSADGGSWTEQDGANRKPLKFQQSSLPRGGAHVISVHQVGTTLHIGYFEQLLFPNNAGTVNIGSFTMGPDTWSGTVIGGGPDAIAIGYPVIGAGFGTQEQVRRGAEHVVAVDGAKENVGGTNYDRIYVYVYNGSTWDAGTMLPDQAGTTQYYSLACIVMGANNMVHIFGKRAPVASPTSANDLVHWSFSASNVAGSMQVVAGVAKTFDGGLIGAAVMNGTEILIPYIQPGTDGLELTAVARATSTAAPTWTLQVVGTDTAKSPSFGTSSCSIAIAVSGSTTRYYWPHWASPGGSHIYYSDYVSGLWSTETSLFGEASDYIEALAAMGFSGGIGITYTDPAHQIGYEARVLYYEQEVAADGDYSLLEQ
jgi:hypothetical protein